MTAARLFPEIPEIDWKELFAAGRLLPLDPERIVEAHRKNIDAWSAAQRVLTLGYQTITKRQVEFMRDHMVEAGGVLISCSCSHHLTPEMLQRAMMEAAKDCGRRLQILERHAHAPDHPIHPAMPETEYLKAFFVRA